MKKILLLTLLFVTTATSAQFKSEDEISVVATGGNTNQTNYNFTSKNSYAWEKDKLTINGSYSYGESDDVTDVDNWSVTVRYDHVLSKRVDIFVADVYESDQFKGFWMRNNYDIGFKYKFIDKEKFKMFSEIGYRYSEENRVKDVPNIFEQKLRLYYEVSKEIKKGTSFRYWLEYIPSLENSDNYIVNMEPSILMLINETFSFRTAVLWEYENEPVDAKDQHDYKTTVSLLANF